MSPRVIRCEPTEIDKEGAPPEEPLGYLAPSVGTFYLGGTSRNGHASFVWYHEEGFIVDFHDHEMTFAGTISPSGSVVFWVYEIHDEDVSDTFYVLLAQSQSDTDEGYRIFYLIHDELHLWVWDAKTFPGHV